MRWSRWWAGMASTVTWIPAWAHADEPIVLRDTWSGNIGFFATGAPMAVDGPDPDTTSVDTLAQPASVQVGVPDVPAGAELRAARLYWGGSIPNSECTDPTDIDDTVDFTPPGGAAVPLVADACFCSVAGSMGYDVQLCRADVTALVPVLAGTYTVDAFEALIANQTTNNASFSIVVVYRAPGLVPRRIGLYDGLLTMSSDTNPEQLTTLGGLDIDDPPSGDLTFYVLEGDVGGSGGEGVQVTGMPGGGMLALSDVINPVGNPMNHTINTTLPVQTDTLGVDVDRFSIDAALLATDDAVQVRYTAGLDKWWLAYDIVGVNVFEPVLSEASDKTWALHDDLDADGLPSPGDTIRYTLSFGNTGNADGVAAVVDPMPSEAASWSLVSAAGGTDVSLGDTLVLVNVPLPVGASTEVVVDVVIDEVPDGTEIYNMAQYTAEPGGLLGLVAATAVVVSNPGAGTGSGESTDGGTSTGAGEGDATGAGTGGGGSSTGTGASSGGVGDVADDTTPGPGAASDGHGSGVTTDATTVGLADDGVSTSACGCRSTPPSSAWWWSMVLLGWRRRAPGRGRARASGRVRAVEPPPASGPWRGAGST